MSPSQIGACHRQATPAWSPWRVYEPLGSPQEGATLASSSGHASRLRRQRQTPPTPWPSHEQALGLWPLVQVFCRIFSRRLQGTGPHESPACRAPLPFS